ncbi:MAG: NlpC/P60 family protein [Actinomycetota bacterium]|nr:NlpC/P60 family protein [Actinomycetota bacterium]
MRSRTYFILILVTAMMMAVVPAHAAPSITDKRAEASEVKKQIDALDIEVEMASEVYNEARIAHETLMAEIAATEARIAEADCRAAELDQALDGRARSMYRNGPLSFLEVLFGSSSFGEFSSTWDFLQSLNENDADMIDGYREAIEEAEAARADLAISESRAKKALDEMTAQKNAIESQLAARSSMLAGIESEIASLEAAEAARVAAAAAASVSRSTSSRSSKTYPAPTNAPRSEVVNIAKKYLGAPYKWGASGPNSFDCSGLTMFVYSQVGVSLPHSSRSQIRVGQRVNRADLQPGDLVFFGSPIHHVGIYVGNNQYIHAPRTGDVVKISSMSRSDYAGATRP